MLEDTEDKHSQRLPLRSYQSTQNIRGLNYEPPAGRVEALRKGVFSELVDEEIRLRSKLLELFHVI